MTSLLRKPVVAAALLTLSPLAVALMGGASDAQAHGRGHGRDRIVIDVGPVVVDGYSYGNPYVYGHVHHSPVYCSHGPVYYYPRQSVYAHYYPRYQYYGYQRPVIRHQARHHRRYLPPHAQFLKNRLRRHADHLRGHRSHHD